MLSRELINAIDEFNEVFTDDNYIVERLRELSTIFQNSVAAFPSLIKFYNDPTERP
jgi:hypothetical protein